MSGAARPLQPATAFSPAVAAGDAPRANGSISPPDSTRPPGGRRQKRTLIESACSACRKRKSRCDGVRPSCSRCMNLRTDCQYEAEEGESRWSALRRRNEILKGERDQLRELLDLLQGRPEYEALDIFHRIRSGTYGDVSHLLQQARDGALTSPHQLSNPHLSITVAADQQRLPPLKALFDNVSSRPPPPTSSSDFPASLLHTQSTSSEDSRSSSISLQNGRSVPDMLEPAFHHLPPTRPPIPKVSSEESSTSVGSSTIDLRPYRIPP